MLKNFDFIEDNGNSLRKAKYVKGMLRLWENHSESSVEGQGGLVRWETIQAA